MKKTVVVSGGTKGLGRSLCLEMASRGHQVVALYHRDDEAATALRASLADLRLEGTVVKQDISAPGLADRLAIPEITNAQQLVLINNACASFAPKPLHLIPREEIDGLFDSNLRGSIFLVQALLRPLVRTRGTVVNVLSTVVDPGGPNAQHGGTLGAGFSAYAMAKYGLLGLTRALAVDHGRRPGREGLKVFSVSPGYMSTALTEAWHPDLQRAFADQQEPPAKVAGFIAALIEDPATPGVGEDHRAIARGN